MDVAGVFGLWVVECWSVARGTDVGWVLSTAHQGCDSGVVVVWPSHAPRPERGSVAFRIFGHVVLQGAGPPICVLLVQTPSSWQTRPSPPPQGEKAAGFACQFMAINDARCLMFGIICLLRIVEVAPGFLKVQWIVFRG